MSAAPPQTTMRELLKDPLFRKWMGKVPTLKVNFSHAKPWRIYVLDEGKWRKTEAMTYAAAYKWVAKHLKTFEDIALTSKAQPFRPPVVRDKQGNKDYWRRFPADHIWCNYCRRPTVFFTFQKHHALPANMCTPYERRCTVCGVRLSFIGPRVVMGAIS